MLRDPSETPARCTRNAVRGLLPSPLTRCARSESLPPPSPAPRGAGAPPPGGGGGGGGGGQPREKRAGAGVVGHGRIWSCPRSRGGACFRVVGPPRPPRPSLPPPPPPPA